MEVPLPRCLLKTKKETPFILIPHGSLIGKFSLSMNSYMELQYYLSHAKAQRRKGNS